MAKVKIQGHASGTGVLTVTAPNTSTDRTITLPDATGTLATTADTFSPDGAVTINDSGADVDFRVESDNDANALFVQGSDGNVGIGEAAPANKLEIRAATTVTTKNGHLMLTSTSGTDGNGPQIVFSESGSSASYAGGSIGFVRTGSNGVGDLVLGTRASAGDANTATTEQLKITSDGRGLSQFTAKFWCTWNQTGTQAISDSHNVSSIADVATGTTRVNFSNDMGGSLYVVNATGRGGAFGFDVSRAAGNVVLGFRNAGDSDEDTANAMCVGYGD